jgi:hypothetical protein
MLGGVEADHIGGRKFPAFRTFRPRPSNGKGLKSQGTKRRLCYSAKSPMGALWCRRDVSRRCADELGILPSAQCRSG